jgi:protein-disulfide isomerase
MVRATGVEPVTHSLEGCCSIHLSYARNSARVLLYLLFVKQVRTTLRSYAVDISVEKTQLKKAMALKSKNKTLKKVRQPMSKEVRRALMTTFGGLLIASLFFSLFAIMYSLQLGFKRVDAQGTAISELKTQISNLKTVGAASSAVPEDTSPTTGSLVVKDSAKKGNSSAKLAVIEFTDFQCPFCKRNFDQTYPSIVKDWVDTGKAVYVTKHFPLSFHANAKISSVSVECAREQGGDAKFWEMHDKVFAASTSDGAKIDKAGLIVLGTQIGLDATTLTTCLDSGKFNAKIDQDTKDGSSIGISGTPGFLVGKYDPSTGKVDGDIIKGAYPYADFQIALEKYNR